MDQVLLYVTCQRIPILIDGDSLDFRGCRNGASQIANNAVSDGNYLHVEESIFHWLTLELSGGEAIRLDDWLDSERSRTITNHGFVNNFEAELASVIELGVEAVVMRALEELLKWSGNYL